MRHPILLALSSKSVVERGILQLGVVSLLVINISQQSCGNYLGFFECVYPGKLAVNLHKRISVLLVILFLHRQYNVDYKLETYLKIARLYLEDDDPVQAEAYINRASLLQNESTNEQLQIHYKVV